MKRVLTLLAALAAAGCATSGYVNDEPLLASLPAGSTLVLNGPLTIYPGSATAYVQGGQSVPFTVLDDDGLHCALLVRRVAERPRTLAPDRFTVTRVFSYEEPYAGLERMVAEVSVGVGIGVGSSDGGLDYTTYRYNTRLQLRSEAQPDVMYMDCGHVVDPAIGEHVTVPDFYNIVGNLMTLQPRR